MVGPVGAEMAQAVRRLGGQGPAIDMAEHVLAREPAPLGEALGEIPRREGIELVLSANATRRSEGAPRRGGDGGVQDPRRGTADGELTEVDTMTTTTVAQPNQREPKLLGAE